MGIYDILNLEDNHSRLEMLEEHIETICPFVGAGVSKGCGLYTWDELLKNLTGRYFDTEYEELVKKFDKLEIVEQVIQNLGNNVSAVMRAVCSMVSEKQKCAVITDTLRILADHFSGQLITTNYDTLLEDLMKKSSKKSKVILPFMQAQTTEAIQDKSPCILKIHGSIEEHTSIVLSKGQYNRAYGKEKEIDLKKPIPQALAQLFGGHRILFVGCSLEEDRTLEVLRAVIQQNDRISHYAIMGLPKEPKEQRKLRIRMETLGIQPIYFPEGKYEYIEIILKYLTRSKKSARKVRWTEHLVKRQKEIAERDVILPWMRNSTVLKAVFPDLFIWPEMKDIRFRKKICFENLSAEYSRKNLILTGNAGVGKTTVLKYLFLYENFQNDFLYLHASALWKREEDISDYESGIKQFLEGEKKAGHHKTIFLDGIDETYMGKEGEFSKLLDKIEKLSNISVWFGWRKEHYINYEDERIRRIFEEVIEIETWDEEMILKYVDIYTQKTKQDMVYPQIKDLIKDSEEIRNLVKTPLHLALLVYLTERDFLESREGQIKTSYSLYSLYNTFFTCWCLEERKRKTSKLDQESIRVLLWEAAEKTYFGETYQIQEDDSALIDLLSVDDISASLGIKNAVGFFHRSFCSFFRANKILDSIIKKNALYLEGLSKPLKNDITDFVRSGIQDEKDPAAKREIQETLINTYYQMMLPEKEWVSKEIGCAIEKMAEQELFYLKNELVYLVTRFSEAEDLQRQFPQREEREAKFLQFVRKHEDDPYMRLDIAYGAVLTGPYEFALDYAKKLIPGTEEDFVNRSWTVAYFGDVHAIPYHYRDTEKAPWGKARAARIKRLQSNTFKAIRFRILDIPLMYCFYKDREWNDISESELEIIKKADTDSPYYLKEESEFLREQKKKLITEYELHLGRITSCQIKRQKHWKTTKKK